MSGGVGLSLFRNFVTGADGRSNVNAENENEQARFSSRADGLELTSHDVSGTGNAFGRGLERVTRFFGRVFSIGRSNPPHKNFEVRVAFRNAILAHLQREVGPLLDDDLPPEILAAFKGELLTNKPLTKRRIQQVLNTVDEYVSREKENLTKNNRPDDKMITRPSDGGMIEMTDMSGEKEEEVKEEEKREKVEVKEEEKREKVEVKEEKREKVEVENEVKVEDEKKVEQKEEQKVEDEEQKEEEPVKEEVKEGIKQQEQPKIEEPVKEEKKIEQKEEQIEEPVKEEKKIEQKEEQKEVKVEQKEVQIEEPVKEEKKKEEEPKNEAKKINEPVKKPEVNIPQPKPVVMPKQEPKIEQQVQPRKQVLPLKNNLVENKLDGIFVSNGHFTRNCWSGKPERAERETNKNFVLRQERYVAEANETLRKDIIPNWKSLTNRIDALRRDTMKALGVDPGLEEWFKRWCPDLDYSSESFLTKAREQMEKGIIGKSVEEVENAILTKCQLKSDLNFCHDRTGKRVVSVSVVVGEMPTNPADDTIYIGKRNGRLTNNDVGNAIKEYCTRKKLENVFQVWMDDSIESVLGMGNVGEFNAAFQTCVKNSGEFDKLLKEEVDSLNHLTYNERQQVAEQISREVIAPIKEAKNIWDIKPIAFMRNFIDLCNKNKPGVKNSDDVLKLVKTVIKAQLDEHFALKVPVGGAKKRLIPSGSARSYVKEAPPANVINSAILNGVGIQQHGGTNCFMVSIVNALLSNTKGQEILKNCFCNNGNGTYRFKDRNGNVLTITDNDVKKWERDNQNYSQSILNMSKLERVIWTAWHRAVEDQCKEVYDEEEWENHFNEFRVKNYPGEQCPAPEIAFLFGLVDANDLPGKNDTKYGVALSGSKLGRWVEAKNHLAAGQFVIAHQGTLRNGHYVAVTGVELGNRVVGKHFTISDSRYRNDRIELDNVQFDGGNQQQGNSSVILLTLPQV